jgi:hypothetical protein
MDYWFDQPLGVIDSLDKFTCVSLLLLAKNTNLHTFYHCYDYSCLLTWIANVCCCC